ncbi:MAG: SusC/RagA family TonB-linked outer membrane protein, partial [Sphingobacteriaceae bacterium]
MIKKRTPKTASAFVLTYKKHKTIAKSPLFYTLFSLFILLTGSAYAQQTITGTITAAEDNSPLPGVSITLKGTTTGAQTNGDGKYQLKLPAGSNQILVFSYMGYTTQEIPAGGKSTINVILTSDQKVLNEVVVSGYTSQSKKDFTGAATRVGGKQLENRPVQSFDQALAGQAPGVSIIQPSGVLNSPPVLRIRGFNSISLSSYPLIIIDGVAVFTGSIGNTVANNPLADINPSDIESMDILKDASATAIYGSRAANGVMVITTKKGKKGATKVSYENWVGFTKAMNLPELLNAEEYVMIKNEAQRNAGIAEGYALQQRSDGSTVDTKWYDAAYRTGVSQNHNLSLSGANDATSYFVSAGYSKQQGIIRTDGFSRKTARANIDHQLSSIIKIGVNFTYSNTFNQGPNSGSLPGQNQSLAGLARMTYIAPPNVAVYNEDGSFNIDGRNSVGFGANTTKGYNAYNLAYLLAYDKYTSENTTMIGNVFGEVEIFKGLKAKTSYAMNRLNVENKSFRNP